MILWLDNHLSPALARWLETDHGLPAVQVRDLGLARALDQDIFDAARSAGAVLLTKDGDFAELVSRRGPPPQIVWLTCGNTSTAALKVLLERAMPSLRAMLDAGEPLIEIG